MAETKVPAMKPGTKFTTVFYVNTKADSRFRWRATHADGKRAAKVILCNDERIEAGVACEVRVAAVRKPAAAGRGHVEVAFVRAVTFVLEEGIWLPPVLKLKLEALLDTGMNILLDGPQGSGKTVLSRAVAKALGMEYVFFNCSSVFEATDFLASLQIRATESGGAETVWVPTDVARAFERARAQPRQRFLVFLDEFNRCREMARNGVMPALDSTRKMFNPITGKAEAIPDNVLWIAAINNGARFTGTTAVDPAQLDRFAPLKMDYPPEDEEVKLLVRRHPNVPQKTVRRLVRVAGRVRGDKELGLDLSMRATDEACTLLGHPNFAEYDGDALPDILKDSFCARVQGHWSDPATDAGLMWKVVSAALAG
ncbi:MAG TPA: MoxR family ATPase [Myxococcota bacterium]|jgi:MoxR-like ATPase|nr:MoxR family ATPase [Myxococcota bacterium]